jgi:acetyl esterase/lipase
MGDSAGGNLAVNLAWSAALHEAASECTALGAVPVPDAVIAGYPVVNPRYTYDNGGQWLLGQRPQDFTEDYIGGTPAQYPERLTAISSMTYASPAAPPTLLFAAGRDDFIPAQGIYDVVQAAQQTGVDITLKKTPFAHHAFDVFTGTLGNLATRSVVVNYLESRGLAPE